MTHTRIKICGITRPEDARAACDLGADAIGVVFYPPSPRAVTLAQAEAIVQVMPAFVTLVALFVNAALEQVAEVVRALPVGVLQFHGDETPAECERYARPYIKAVPMRRGVDLPALAEGFAGASALLLDTYHQEKRGGTGKTFDWSLVPARLGKPIVLSGGLTPENVAEAVDRVRPYGVDVSGGVEAAKGIKDREKMARFIGGVRRADYGH